MIGYRGRGDGALMNEFFPLLPFQTGQMSNLSNATVVKRQSGQIHFQDRVSRCETGCVRGRGRRGRPGRIQRHARSWSHFTSLRAHTVGYAGCVTAKIRGVT